MIQKIISGGQTGADRGGLEAAMILELDWGGYVPKGRRSEDGRVPERYHKLVELLTSDYPARTRRNVLGSDGTVIFTKGPMERGSLLTSSLCNEENKPFLHIDLSEDVPLWRHGLSVREFVSSNCVKTLNVAGNRESVSHGIQKTVEQILVLAFLNGDRRA